jgi:hypothetical protein
VLLRIWGVLYDVTYDGNEVERSQWMCGLSGWFVQWLNNRLKVAVTFHPGMGPGGDSREEMTSERGAPYALMGFAITGRMSQLPLPFPYVWACVTRNNLFDYGYRVVLMLGYGRPTLAPTPVAIDDVVIDRNENTHSDVGIELDASVADALIYDNTFQDVREPLHLANPRRVLVLHSQ